MIERDELAAWLRLLGTPQLGRDGARRLLAAFGSPQAVFEASAGALRELAGSLAAVLTTPPSTLDDLVEAIERLADPQDEGAIVEGAPIEAADDGDTVPTAVEIDRALAQLETVARQRGIAVGVASALPISIDRIAAWIRMLESRGILLVPLTTAMQKSKSG